MDSDKLRKKYREHFLSQTKIAESIGVKHYTISLWLNGTNCIGEKKLIKLERLIDECK